MSDDRRDAEEIRLEASYRLNDTIILLCECERVVDVALFRAGSVWKRAALG